MSEEVPAARDPPPPDMQDVASALRRQIDAVKAQMQAHREVMQAAGLFPPTPDDSEMAED